MRPVFSQESVNRLHAQMQAFVSESQRAAELEEKRRYRFLAEKHLLLSNTFLQFFGRVSWGRGPRSLGAGGSRRRPLPPLPFSHSSGRCAGFIYSPHVSVFICIPRESFVMLFTRTLIHEFVRLFIHV